MGGGGLLQIPTKQASCTPHSKNGEHRGAAEPFGVRAPSCNVQRAALTAIYLNPRQCLQQQ